MAVGTAAVLALTAARGISTFVGQRRQANAVQSAGAAERDLYNTNASVADQQASDALARGRENESIARTQTRGLIGSQRAAMAASGVQLGDGSTADVEGDTAYLGELDALTIRNNATREAWGYSVEAAGYRQQGNLAYAAGRNEAASLRDQSFGTLLTTGAQMVDLYGERPQAPKAPPTSSLTASQLSSARTIKRLTAVSRK